MRTHTTHTAQPVYLYPWVDIPAFCPLVTAPSAHHTTPHHTTPKAVRQCAAGVPLPTAPRQCSSVPQEFHCPLPQGRAAV